MNHDDRGTDMLGLVFVCLFFFASGMVVGWVIWG